MLTIKKTQIGLALVTLATALIIVFTFSFTVEGQNENNDETEKIMNLEKAWSAKSTEGALDWIIDLHSDSAVQLPPGGDLVQGKAALRTAWDGMVNTEGLEVSWEPTKAFVSKSGDMAYDYGKAKIKNPDGSVVNAKYLVVWSKINGEWKVVADMFNMNGSSEK